MAQYLVVVYQTATSPVLVRRLRELATADSRAEFTLLVPATHAKHLLVRPEVGSSQWTWSEHDDEQRAQRRAEEAARVYASAGLRLARTGIGDDSPLLTIEDELRANPDRYHAIVLGTLPPATSRWLRLRVRETAERRFGIAVLPVFEGGEREWESALQALRGAHVGRRRSSRFAVPELRPIHVLALMLLYLVLDAALALGVDRRFFIQEAAAVVIFTALFVTTANQQGLRLPRRGRARAR